MKKLASRAAVVESRGPEYRCAVRFLSAILVFSLLSSFGHSAPKPASVSSIVPSDLHEFDSLGPKKQELIRNALQLTSRNLRYLFGSNVPEKGGMDCSGSVQWALKSAGWKEVPRSSFAFYQWVEKEDTLKKTEGVTTTEDPVFSDLQPGDLLFWQGTYDTGKRNSSISHVMIYIGTLEKDGRGVVFGASDGRRYRGKRINGVSVFDWKVPSATSTSKFVGYARIPGIGDNVRVDLEDQIEEPPKKVIKSALEKIFRKREPAGQ